MSFDALTLFPEFFEVARLGITGRAFRELGHGLHTHSYRLFAGNAFGHVTEGTHAADDEGSLGVVQQNCCRADDNIIEI